MVFLGSTSQDIFTKEFFGFDIETYDDNKQFLLASICGVTRDGYQYEKVFYSPREVIEELKTNRLFKDSVLFATNLSFDFFGTFFTEKERECFSTVFSGSNLLFTKTYFDGDTFTASKTFSKCRKERKSLLFIDSLNFAKMSVKRMGEVIGFPKLESPSWIGGYPKDHDAWVEMERYNIRDSWVTFKFMEFLIRSFEHLGATFKYTIASTSMSLFKNRYLGDYKVYQPDRETLLEIFKAYYGGRTETFKRGSFGKCKYYDFNSLYPSVMHDYAYPDPNTMRIVVNCTDEFVKEFEGVSDVDIVIPDDIHIPPLPYRLDDGKVIFPTGRLRGWFTHVELRKALDQGAVIEKVRKSIYYTHMVAPFKKFVEDLYNLRLKYKSDGNPLQLVTKLFMNSLYGKFGEKFVDKRQTMHESMFTKSKMESLDHFEIVGEYITFTEDTEPKSHCVPIWAVYVTAYARLKMFETLKGHDPIYCDTDSIVTKDSFPESNELGALKLEMSVDEGVTVRPKFYALKSSDSDVVKLKGLGRRLSWIEFWGVLENPIVEYTKFAKLKESLRRKLVPNQAIVEQKEFSLEDSKRDWGGRCFDVDELQTSKPRRIISF